MHQVILVLLLVLVTIDVCELVNDCPNLRTPLNLMRRKRYLAFPDNSDVVLTASLLTAFLTHIPAGWNLALEIDVLFPLPDLNFTVAHAHKKKLHHRQKKELWTRFEDALSFHNLDGRACVLKSICEAKVYLAPPGKSLVHDILRAVFAVPEMDQEFRNEVEGFYDELLTPDYCEKIGSCPVSLLHFILVLNERKH
ncbi:uncharacterized protein LOC114358311 [Ostrinia furnacalis]|uniref:uncharacterized protein LOC114358311 n=1 Tax=Ostrinia furnacalis TaxID=93504 RepID=UPI00103A57D4|nr:uncharacterized protein LOC114358311 [Ostrinia furnacalis]